MLMQDAWSLTAFVNLASRQGQIRTVSSLMPTEMGRPKLPEKERKGEVFSVRVSRDQAKQIWVAIDASGKKKSVWLREVLVDAAKAGKAMA